MPAPALVDREALLGAARDEWERGGDFTMAAIAARLGVKPPSLYKHVRDRDALRELVRRGTLGDLRARYRNVADDPAIDTAPRRLAEMMEATRAYAGQYPQATRLAFAPVTDAESVAELADTVAPLLDACREIVGDAHALDAARTVTAWIRGFTDMEAGGAFHLGGDVDRAFAFGRDLMIRGLTAAGDPASD